MAMKPRLLERHELDAIIVRGREVGRITLTEDEASRLCVMVDRESRMRDGLQLIQGLEDPNIDDLQEFAAYLDDGVAHSDGQAEAVNRLYDCRRAAAIAEGVDPAEYAADFANRDPSRAF